MIAPSPLVDFFKRGEVARDVRLLAAQGVLAPRAYDQLSILVMLLEDQDPEIRSTAAATLDRIPREALAAFLGRSDVPLALREFFADRGIFPAETPAIDMESPLIEVSDESAAFDPTGPDPLAGDEADKQQSITQALAKMNFPERLKAAIKGTREVRAVLIRDPNKMISAAVLSSPKLTEQEVESFVRMGSVSEDVLRVIGSNRSWTKNYSVIVGLTKNPKTPLAMAMNFVARLNDTDIKMLAIDRNVPEPLRIAARKRVVAARG